MYIHVGMYEHMHSTPLHALKLHLQASSYVTDFKIFVRLLASFFLMSATVDLRIPYFSDTTEQVVPFRKRATISSFSVISYA